MNISSGIAEELFEYCRKAAELQSDLGAVTKLTIQIALDGFLRSRKKTQPYRGTARLSDEEIGKPDKQDV